MEQDGIPVVLFCTTPFVPMAKSIAEAQGMPDLRIVELDHPLGGLVAAEVEQRADQIVDAVRAFLREVT